MKLNTVKKGIWENPEITRMNRVKAHTRWGAYENAEQAALVDASASKWVKSLDGRYDFKLYNNPEEVEPFYRDDDDISGFSSIYVPGNWETQGFGLPLYTNTDYPWSLSLEEKCTIEARKGKEKVVNPPYLPSDNPTGCYRRTFEVSKEYLEREVFIRFDGVEAAYLLWINGEWVGYSEDSKLPSEFLITPYLKAGENLLAVQVMRFCTGTWLEDQDYWYLSGIFRSVSLIAKPALRIDDYQITAIPDLHHKCGTFSADVHLSRVEGFGDCKVKAVLRKDDTVIGEGIGHVEAEAAYTMQASYILPGQATAAAARISFTVPEVEKWTPETPVLYTVVFTLIDGAGNEIDFESCRIGFKKIEIVNGIVLLNGQRLIIRGVNRHEHCLDGRTLTREHMIEEIRQMKRMNMNSVRTSHYPSMPLWYDLCDEYGLLLVCECNIETHGVHGALTHNPEYSGHFLERGVRMAQNYKNHVSIYSWSLGNESGYGANHAAMYGFLKEYDHTRLCQYEAGFPGKNISDIRGNMYETIEGILRMLADPEDTRPIILVEYLYQICNSGGGAKEFRDLVERYPRFQGGYVWDWQDKNLWAVTTDGTGFFGYAKDFGEPYYDRVCPPFMVSNGLVLPDLTWKPVAFELKQVYAPIWVEKEHNPSPWSTVVRKDILVLKNRSLTETTRDYEANLLLKENGIVIKSQTMELPLLTPGQETKLEVNIPYDIKPNCEYHLDVVLYRKVPLWYETEKEEVFHGQFMQESAIFLPISPSLGKIDCLENETEVTVTSNDFTITFDKQSGQITSLGKPDGDGLLWGGEPRFDRPRTGLDCQPNWGWYDETSALQNTVMRVLSATVTTSENKAVLMFEMAVETARPYPITGHIVYTVSEADVHVSYFANVPEMYQLLSRAGLRFILPDCLDEITYFGYGPGECYSDRMASVTLGVYDSTVDKEHFAFIPPSENGGHEDTRWLKLSDGSQGLCIKGDTPFHFDIRRNSTEEYWIAKHDHELPKGDNLILHIDAMHAPIGSHMSWSTGINREKQPGGGGYYLGFSLKVIEQ